MEPDGKIVEINSISYLDEDTHSIIIQVERVGISFYVEEFLDFFKSIEEIKDFLLENPMYTVGKLMGDDEGKEIIVPKPDEDDYT